MKIKGHSGFTLIEVIVALAIVSISFVMIMQLFSGGLRASRSSCDYTRAVVHAKNKMEELSFDPIADSGNFDDGFNWRTELEPYEEPEDGNFKLMKLIVKFMPLFGQDPHRFGRNGDVDLTRRMSEEYPIHAVVRLNKQSVETRSQAIACHRSQSSWSRKRPSLFRMMELAQKLQGSRDSFMRAYPLPNQHREKDLFEGLL